MVGLDGEDAGRCFDELFLFQDGRGPGIGSNADVLEEHSSEEEVHIIGERVELWEPGSFGGCREASLEIDRRPADRLAAERLAVEANVSELVLGQFLGELLDVLAMEFDLMAALDVAGI